MAGAGLPRSAAWRHRGAREGFEVVIVEPGPDGVRFDGGCAAVEGRLAWFVEYGINLDRSWCTREARVAARSAAGRSDLQLETDGDGRWQVNGVHVPHLDGCLDVDLEASSLTNAFSVHRLALAVGEAADAPAAYVRAHDVAVERLEQRYVRMTDGERGQRYHYMASAFDFECELIYDESGLVIEYPGLATRTA